LNGAITGLASQASTALASVSATLYSNVTALRSDTETASASLYEGLTALRSDTETASASLYEGLTALRSDTETASASLYEGLTALRSDTETASASLYEGLTALRSDTETASASLYEGLTALRSDTETASASLYEGLTALRSDTETASASLYEGLTALRSDTETASASLYEGLTALRSDTETASASLYEGLTALRSDTETASASLYSSLTSLHNELTTSYVTLTSDQTISGHKTFTNLVQLSAATGITMVDTDDSTHLATTAFVKSVSLDQLTAPRGDVDFNDKTLTNLHAPDQDTDAATKAYVDAAVTGINIHQAAKAGTVADLDASYDSEALTLTFTGDVQSVGGTVTALSGVDGVDLVVGDRVLVKDQTDQTENGVYEVSSLNNGIDEIVLIRSSDYNNNIFGEARAGDFIFVVAGTVNASAGFVQTIISVIPCEFTVLISSIQIQDSFLIRKTCSSNE
jgi:hypothetical protein